jgi:predicted transcriptional regulator
VEDHLKGGQNEEHLATLRRILDCTEECNKAQVQTIYLMVQLCITSQMNQRTTPLLHKLLRSGLTL